MKLDHRFFLKILFISIAFIITNAALAYSASVSLRWDANDPSPEGYRVFAREDGGSYGNFIWEGADTTCNLIGLSDGVTYHFVVRAYDGDLESENSDEVTYNPPVPNQPPYASAGQNQTVLENVNVTLNGSGSSDSDGSIASYQWVQTGGELVTLGGANQVTANFLAPVVGFDGDILSFRLTVTDDDGSSAISTCSVSVLKSPSTDVDGDSFPDVLDAFPNDPNEWADADGDGTGNNADLDDDNDGMPDSWELTYGLDPLTDDAEDDLDGDGWTNLVEFQMDTDPMTFPGNTAPDAPVIDSLVGIDRVGLTPVLVSGEYFDADNDAHHQSNWQISIIDFSQIESDENIEEYLALNVTTQSHLTAYTVNELVLDTNTRYWWRVRFIDEHNGASPWSDGVEFTTIEAENSEDTNLNGIPDDQEVSDVVFEDGDIDIMAFSSTQGDVVIGVEAITAGVNLVCVKSIAYDAQTHPIDPSIDMGMGLIGFKLDVPVGSAATVNIYFSKAVPENADLYKYHVDDGWYIYNDAVFAEDRKSVMLTLVDGGNGDEDGVANGIIVDPSGVGYSTSTVPDGAYVSTGTTSVDSGSSGVGCFISTGTTVDMRVLNGLSSSHALLIAMILLAAGIMLAIVSLNGKND